MFQKNYKPALRKAIITRIDFEGYTDADDQPVNPQTDDEKILFLFNTFRSEAGHEITRNGTQKALEYWLSGLPSCINLPVYHSDVLAFAVEIGSVTADYTEKEADKICEGFYGFMANNIRQMYDAAIRRRSKVN
jgi:hypothetical protein